MFALVVQTLLLIAIAFILGAVVGCLLRGLFGSSSKEVAPAAEIAPATAETEPRVAQNPASTASVPVSAKSSPVIPNPPMPQAPVQPAEKAKVETPAAGLVSASSTPPPAKKSSSKPAGRKASAPKAKKPAASAKVVKPSGEPDNLKLIKGIGPQNEGRLNALGVTQFAQIAAWKRKDEAHYGEVLAFPGRIEREEWVKQAKVLQKGGTTDFSKRAKAGTVSSSLGTAKAGDMGTAPTSLLKKARGDKADNLTLIDGVGNAIEKKMFKLGIFHFDQIAAMSKAELAWLGNMVGFPGRPERENWAGEAKVLAAGGGTASPKKTQRGQIKSRRK